MSNILNNPFLKQPTIGTYRYVATKTTQPMRGDNLDKTPLNPCACIKKIVQAKAPVVNKGAADRPTFLTAVKAYEIGETAYAVYTDNKNPAKWTIATDAQLKAFGFKSGKSELQLLDEKRNPTHFRAQLYIPITERFCYPMKPVLAFRGTVMNTKSETIESWLINFYQGIGNETPYYTKALRLGNMLSGDIEIAGHSLGGGLAAACVAASGKKGWTYNAAGLHPSTVAAQKISIKGNPELLIDAYRHEGEILTKIQEMSQTEKEGLIKKLKFGAVAGGATMGGGVGALGGPVTAIWGGIAGAIKGNDGAKWAEQKIREAPKAPGIKHNFPAYSNAWSSINRHGMHETLVSFNTLLIKQEDAIRKDLGVNCSSRVVIERFIESVRNIPTPK